MATTYSICIPGTPPRKNRRHIIARGRMINSKEFKLFTQEVGEARHAAGHPNIHSGTWSLRVHACWPRTRHLDIDIPLGDVDAPISWILDAMQAAGVLDDDARVMSLAASKSQGKDTGVWITLTPL